MSGEPKKLFRYLLVGIFINTIEVNKNDEMKKNKNLMERHEYISAAQMILRFPKAAPHISDLYINRIQQAMEDNFFHDPKNPNIVVKINTFFREKLKHLKAGKRFWKVEEFEKIFSVEDYLKNLAIPVKNHHWIDFNIYYGIIPTYPEHITYNDLINSWNLILERTNKYHLLEDNHNQRKQLEYEIFSLQRYSYTSCVTFFESYLFYLFYNLKSENAFKEDETIQKMYKRPYIKVNDTDILDHIIEPKLITNSCKEKYKELLKEYKKLNDIRNSIIHTSAFETLADQTSSMELFMPIDIDLDILKKEFELVIEFSLFIESLLPEEFKILFWWDRFENPDFNSRRKIKRTSIR